MSEWFETLDSLRTRVWEMLAEGASSPNSPAHTASLATVGLGGAAEARMVVLRGASATDATLEVHTDRASRKVDELQADPRQRCCSGTPPRACRSAPGSRSPS